MNALQQKSRSGYLNRSTTRRVQEEGFGVKECYFLLSGDIMDAFNSLKYNQDLFILLNAYTSIKK